MSKFQRCLQLIHEVEVRPGQSGKQLADRFECSERTIMRDIRHLEEQVGLIITNENGYRFFNKPFLPPLALTWDEVVAVILAQSLAQRQLDARTSAWLSNAVEKMRRGMAGAEKRVAERVKQQTVVLPSAATESDTAVTLLSELTRATQENLEISFWYQGRSDAEPEQRWAEPAGMSFQESRWYLLAYDLAREGERTFRLGRMSGLVVSATRFVPKITFSADKAAFHQWDLGSGDPVELTLNVSPGLARWFEENKPHPTVSCDDTTVTLSVNDPEAFLRWFASLDDAELIAPQWCREKLAERLEGLAKLYPR